MKKIKGENKGGNMSKEDFSLKAETEAMQSIAVILEKLPKESKQRIVNWLLSIVGFPPQPTPPSSINAMGSSDQKVENIKDFFQSKQPKNQYQKLAVLGYYLEFMKGKDEFNTQDLKNAWRQTREALPTPQSFSNALNNTLSIYNYFVSSQKKGLYRIGIRGQNLVEKLPEQSKSLTGPARKRRRHSRTK